MLSENKGGFHTYSNEDCEYLHPEANAGIKGDSLTETQYFGINLPSERIHGLAYCWHHPNVNSVTGGAWVWQGNKKHHLLSELFDFHSFMSESTLENDLGDFSFHNSYRSRIIKPLEHFRLTYSDPSRKNSFDLEYKALTPVIMWADGVHFEQAMKVTGELVLQGKHYEVDSYNVRDRSWAALRPENNMALPPVAWKTGWFDDDMYFTIVSADHPDLDPVWKGKFALPGNNLTGGWLWRKGELMDVVSCRKKTHYDMDSLYPTAIDMELQVRSGETFVFRGTIVAANCWTAWLNCNCVICLVKWEHEGKVGYGDVQEAQWTDFMRAFMKG